MGYTGKQIIHPGQIDIVQNAFMPCHNRINWATELLDEYENFQAKGKVSFNFNVVKM